MTNSKIKLSLYSNENAFINLKKKQRLFVKHFKLLI